MSFKANYEHILHIESFRNIDLYQQGLYYMRFYLTIENDRKVDYSQPYNFLESKPVVDQQKRQVKNRDNHCWAEAQILDDVSAFQSKTFMIRFQEEEVQINETCFFKMELPAYPSYDQNIFTLYCELMCADIQKIGGPPSEDQDQLFKCVAVYQSKIRNSQNSIHEFIPILFDNHHFCVINCTMHTMLQDFRFKLSEMQVQLSQQQPSKENSRKGIFGSSESLSIKSVVSVQPKTFIEFMNKATQRFDKEQCEWFFNYYIGQLKQQCCNMKQIIEDLYQHLNKNDLVLPPIPQYSHLKYTNLTDIQAQKGQSLQITDVLDVKNIKNQNQIASHIEQDVATFSGTLFLLNNMIIKLILDHPKEIRKYFQNDYQTKIKDKWGESYLRVQIKTDDLSSFQQKIGNSFSQVAAQLRKNQFPIDSGLDIEDQDLIPTYSLRAILNEEIFSRNNQGTSYFMNQQLNFKKTNVKIINIVVLVHGFQGTSHDLRLIKNNLSLLYPDSLYMCSRSNEEQTDGHIGEMGRNLAIEVKQFIKEWTQGHSLGGIIIRAALPLLHEYQNQMWSFVTMSSPHLGYMYNSSKIIEAGLWVLKRMRKSFSLQQLSMTDAESIEETFLYKLSKQPGLNWFQHILFLSSLQDQYVPYESARVQKCQESQSDMIKGKKYERMVDNLLGCLRTNEIHRIDVNFVLEETTIDNMIGRTAHIQFLENSSFQKALLHCTENIFQ